MNYLLHKIINEYIFRIIISDIKLFSIYILCNPFSVLIILISVELYYQNFNII